MSRFRSGLIAFCLALLFCFGAGHATQLTTTKAGSASFNSSGFGFKSPISVEDTLVGNNPAITAEDVNNFIVQLQYTDNRFKTVGNGGHVQDAQGDDIRPYSDSTCLTAITGYEKQFYDGSAGKIVINVKRNLSHTADTVFYLCYGKASLTTDGTSLSGTYGDAGYISVYHFEDAGGGTLNRNDAFGSRNSTGTTGTVGFTSSGLFGGAATVGEATGTSKIDWPASYYLASLSSAVVEVWIKTSETRVAALAYPYAESSNVGAQYFQMWANGSLATYNGGAFALKASDAVNTDVKLNTAINNGAWHALTLYGAVVDASTYGMNFTIDAADTTNTNYIGANRSTNHTYTGTPDGGSTGYGFTAVTIDEMRLGNSATRGGGVSDPRQWVWTLNNNGQNPTTFAVLGTEGTP